jgi:hypothetical protein
MAAIKIVGKLNPKQYSEMLDHLTRKKIKNPFIKAKDIVVDKKPEVEEREMFNRFNQANPRQDMAGGGMLVQPGFGGTRQGYKEESSFDTFGKLKKKVKVPKGYITPYEFSIKHGLPYTPAKPGDKGKRSLIGNHLMRKTKRVDSPQTVNRAREFLIKKLKPKQILINNIPAYFVKDDKVGGKLAKEVITYFDSTLLRQKTMDNIDKILNKKKYKSIKKLFEKGDYKEIKKALLDVKEFTLAEKANIMLRVGQGMDGRTFRDFNLNIKKNKKAAGKIFRGLEKEQWGSPFEDSYRTLKRDVITSAIGDKYFTSTYTNFLQNAKNALKKRNLWYDGMDLNELTGLSSGYKNQTFSSTQFVNLMDSEFNRGDHANLLKEYGLHEARLQKSLSGKRPNYDAAAKEVKKFKEYKKSWFNDLDPKYQTQQLKSILPDFKITNNASKVFTKQRLEEFRKLDFPIEEEIKQMGYVKTAGTKKIMSETPILKEVASGDPKALEKIDQQLASFPNNPKCIIAFRKKKAEGGRIGYVTGSANLTECAKDGARVFNDGKLNTADQIKDGAKLLRGGRAVLSALSKYGIVPELAYVGLEAAGRTILGEKPTNALLKSIDTLTFGATDFTSEIEAEKFGEYAKDKLAVDAFRSSQAKVRSILNNLEKLEQINLQGGETDVTQELQTLRAQLKSASDELRANTVNPDLVQFIDKRQEEISDTELAKSPFAKKSLTDQLEGFPGIKDYMDTEATRVFPFQQTQKQLNEKVMPSLSSAEDFLQLSTQDLIKRAQILRLQGEDVSAQELIDYQNSLKNATLSELAESGKFSPTSIYGASEKFSTPLPSGALDKKPNVIPEMEREIVGQTNVANPFDIDISDIGSGLRGFAAAGGGIAKEAGDRSGPPPERGPMSQGLQGLMKRVRNL